MKRGDTPRAPLSLEFDPEAAEEKALVRVRQAAVAAPGRLYVLRSGGAALEVVALGIVILGTAAAAIVLFGGSGDVLDSPRGAVAAAVLVATLVVALVVGVAGQLLVAQAAVARNTRLMTSILAEMNLAITATATAAATAAQPRVTPVVVSAVPESTITPTSAIAAD